MENLGIKKPKILAPADLDSADENRKKRFLDAQRSFKSKAQEEEPTQTNPGSHPTPLTKTKLIDQRDKNLPHKPTGSVR